MNIYFSGIGGVALGPLAEVARDAGHTVMGSDPLRSLTVAELEKSGVRVSNDQSGAFLQQCHSERAIDWFVYTAALPADHPELLFAREVGIAHITKRDEFIQELMQANNLKMIAIAGTHGKTTTTAMLVWVLQQLGIPISYSVGTTLSFGPSGKYVPGSEYFIYECDEFDRNFLHFSPHLSLITSIDYDHPDTYPTVEEYAAAFTQFMQQSEQVIMWRHDTSDGVQAPSGAWLLEQNEALTVALAGVHNRANATLVAKALEYIGVGESEAVQQALEAFPGSQRRFEKLAENLYSDYGHHPVEIAATLQLARELSEHVVLVYQPHQNVRQHQIRNEYTDCMAFAEQIFWLPTYLSREDPSLTVLTPDELVANLSNRENVHVAELDDELWKQISAARAAGKLVLCMGAGSIDGWVRERLAGG